MLISSFFLWEFHIAKINQYPLFRIGQCTLGFNKYSFPIHQFKHSSNLALFYQNSGLFKSVLLFFIFAFTHPFISSTRPKRVDLKPLPTHAQLLAIRIHKNN